MTPVRATRLFSVFFESAVMQMSSIPRRWRSGATILAAMALSAGLVACGSDTISPPQTGALTLRLTDAPFPFDSVARADLYIVRIDGKRASTDSADAQRNTGDDENGGNTDVTKGWVTLATPDQSYNLLDLQGGKTVNLGQVTLPTGTYRGFRLILDVDKSSVTLTDGTVLTGNSVPGIKFPSASRTGVKIVLDAPVSLTANGSVMTLDFDLGRSFVMRGHTISQNGLLFKPVIRATAEDETGAISGTVRASTLTGEPVADATVEILKAGTTLSDTVSANLIATTKTDANGVYTVAFLLPGTYAVRVTPPSTATTLDPALVDDVQVTSGDTTSGTDVVLPSSTTVVVTTSIVTR
jgi:hypothetical protein